MSYEVSRHNTAAASSFEEFRCGRCSKPFSECKCTLAMLSTHVGHSSGISNERALRMDVLGKAQTAKYGSYAEKYKAARERRAASNRAYRERVKAGTVGTVKTGRPTQVNTLEKGAVVKKPQVAYQKAHKWSMEPQGPKTRRSGSATRRDKKLAKELGL